MKRLSETPNQTAGRLNPKMGRSTIKFSFRPILFVLLSLLVVSSMIVFPSPQPVQAAGDTPVVNGLFYGDGDNTKYQLFATSEYGSGLYTYYDAPSSKLYVALVVTHDVNDMVCSDSKDAKAYTSSAGWNSHRSCKRASDSEFASFTFQCAPDSPNSWAWQQGFACAASTTSPDSNWKSDATCTSSLAGGAWPPSTQASTSWVANVNTYQTAYPYGTPWPPTPAPPWNMYIDGIVLDSWRSPFVASAPLDVTQVPGYPTYSTYEQIAPGHSPVHGWEWSMIYEWSIDMSPGGANCGNEPIYLVTGLSHHSPSKNDDQNDEFSPPPEDFRLSDWGDLPDSYGTSTGNNGAYHILTANGAYLGQNLQTEVDGEATADATGDGSEEDGIVFTEQAWTPGATVQVEATVSGNNGYLVGWVDWNNDGSFSAGEMVNFGALADGTHTLDVTVPTDASTLGHFYVRFRLYDSTNLPTLAPTGAATGGEVEDYLHSWTNPTVVDLASFTAWAQDGAILLEWETATELDSIGFYLYRAESPTGRRIQINSELIASHGSHSLIGALYTHPGGSVEPGLTYYYWIEVLNSAGSGTTYGPVSATAPIASPDTPISHRVFLPRIGK